jgi:hypothetical protein
VQCDEATFKTEVLRWARFALGLRDRMQPAPIEATQKVTERNAA